jgi:hydrogenase maturation factor
MKVGKLAPQLLQKLLSQISANSLGTKLGPALGEDAAIIRNFRKDIVITTDPVTLVSSDTAEYLIHINANDIAASGGKPKGLLITILAPPQSQFSEVEEVFKKLTSVCQKLKIGLWGGHTEVTPQVNSLIIIGCMLGELEKKVTTGGAKVGDKIILTKGIPIEGISIIAREKESELKGKVSNTFLERAKNFITTPGISILKEAKIALKTCPIHAFHDPTEGGLAMGLYELALASQCGILVEFEKIPIFPEFEVFQKRYQLDPLGTIASGSLLISVAPRWETPLLKALQEEKIPVSPIGQVMPKEFGVKLKRRGKLKKLPYFSSDEITKLFKTKEQ